MSQASNIPNAFLDSVAAVKSAVRDESVDPGDLTPRSRINEQELFAVLVHQQLGKIDSELAATFEKKLPKLIEKVKEFDSKNSVFRAVKQFVRGLVRDGNITREIGKRIRAFAIGKAQLDSDRTRLSTERQTDAAGDTPLRSLENAYKASQDNGRAAENELSAFRSKNRREFLKIRRERLQNEKADKSAE